MIVLAGAAALWAPRARGQDLEPGLTVAELIAASPPLIIPSHSSSWTASGEPALGDTSSTSSHEAALGLVSQAASFARGVGVFPIVRGGWRYLEERSNCIDDDPATTIDERDGARLPCDTHGRPFALPYAHVDLWLGGEPGAGRGCSARIRDD